MFNVLKACVDELCISNAAGGLWVEDDDVTDPKSIADADITEGDYADSVDMADTENEDEGDMAPEQVQYHNVNHSSQHSQFDPIRKLEEAYIRTVDTNSENINVLKFELNEIKSEVRKIPVKIYDHIKKDLQHNAKAINDLTAREIASEFTYNALGRNVPIIYARRVGKTSDAQNRRVLIQLKHYNDVLELIQSPSNGNVVEFQHFHDTKDSAIEMVHKNFLKKSLNISKHASNTCIYKELKRCPVTYRAWAMAIKYWIRLNSGTENCLLNEAYKMSQAENHQWLQSIHYLLNMHGFSDIWNNPSVPGDTLKLLNYGLMTNLIKVW